jgi:hypothetical protein
MKVVCIDNSPLNAPYFAPNGMLEKDTIYHVDGVISMGNEEFYLIGDKPLMLPTNPNVQGGWSSRRFVSIKHYNAEFLITNEKETL